MTIFSDPYAVTFMQGRHVLCEVTGQGIAAEDKEHDAYGTLKNIVAIITSATHEVQACVEREKIPKNTLKRYDSIVIKGLNGTSTTYSVADITRMKDDLADLTKFNIDRKTRLVVYKVSGFIGGSISEPTDTSLNILSEEDFIRVKKIIDLLQRPSAKLDYVDCSSDCGYYVKVGHEETRLTDMRYIFEGGSTSPTPAIVVELEKILQQAIILGKEVKFESKPTDISDTLTPECTPGGVEATTQILTAAAKKIEETGKWGTTHNGGDDNGYCENVALKKLPLATTELARTAASLICKRLGQLEKEDPEFKFDLMESADPELAFVILTNSICNPLSGQGQVENTVISIEIDPEGKFMVLLGSGRTYSGDGNDAEAVANIPERIARARSQRSVITNG